mgnify:CR=1 FL=1
MALFMALFIALPVWLLVTIFFHIGLNYILLLIHFPGVHYLISFLALTLIVVIRAWIKNEPIIEIKVSDGSEFSIRINKGNSKK